LNRLLSAQRGSLKFRGYTSFTAFCEDFATVTAFGFEDFFVVSGPHTPGVVAVVAAFSGLILSPRPTAYGLTAACGIRAAALAPPPSAQLAGGKGLLWLFRVVADFSNSGMSCILSEVHFTKKKLRFCGRSS
jgi:hypothetical protein